MQHTLRNIFCDGIIKQISSLDIENIHLLKQNFFLCDLYGLFLLGTFFRWLFLLGTLFLIRTGESVLKM
jgi:hypothetical protein